MAAFDALLHLLVAEGADALTLVSDAVPVLDKRGTGKPLSMPPLSGEMLERFAAELRESSSDGRYTLDGRGVHVTFDVAMEESGRIEFRVANSPAAATAARSATEPTTEPTADATGTQGPSRTAPVGSVHGARPAPLERPAVLEQAVARALDAGTTDVFLSTSAAPRMRVGGTLREMPELEAACDAGDVLALLDVHEAARRRLEAHGSVDLAARIGGSRVRANVFRHHGGLAAAIRPVRRVRTFAELGLPGDLGALTRYKDGLVLVVGPAGAGKSTTLASLVDHVRRSRACHVLTIEDPVEVEYGAGASLVHQREVGRDVESFAAGLWAALRESPDVILLGEMRDPQTVAAALTAAETGHLVLSTLHSGSAPMAVDRIIDAFPPHQQAQVRNQLAGVLRAVLTQVLIPTPAGTLVPAVEKMIVTPAIAHMIRDSRGHQLATHIQTGRAEGMVSLELSLADLVRRRVVSREAAEAAARDPELLASVLR